MTISFKVIGQPQGKARPRFANGHIYNTPSDDCIIAAKICLEGYTLSDKILYFMDAKAASNMWTARNRKFAFLIGNHSFYN